MRSPFRFPRRRGAVRSWIVLALLGLAAIGYATGGEETDTRPGPPEAKRDPVPGGAPPADGVPKRPAKPPARAPGAGRPPAPGTGAVRAQLIRVVDGDTIAVAIGGSSETVRYIGVDTPESVDPNSPVECGGPEASAANRRLLGSGELVLSFGPERRDRYGRLLAYVRAGRLFVNEALIRRGLARTLAISPNTELASRFAMLERGAARRGVGIWGSCGY